MQLDYLNIPIHDVEDLIQILYTKHDTPLNQFVFDNSLDICNWNKYAFQFETDTLVVYESLNIDQDTFDNLCQTQWYMPEEYTKIDIWKWCVKRCTNQIEKERITQELEVFEQKKLFNLLRYIIYLVDVMRENNCVWGVGRGSSVASFVLYIIGIHKINPITYDLNWREFLR